MTSGKKSCDKIDTEQIEIEIVLFEPFESSLSPLFPNEIINILKPLNCLCNETKNVAFTPVVVNRKDLSIKSTHDYLSHQTGNNAKILMVERAFKNYFEDIHKPVSDSLFSSNKGNNSTFENYIEINKEKSNVFVYSTNGDFKTNFSKIYTSTADIVVAISELICKGVKGKITIVIAPNEHNPSIPNDLQEIFRQITDLNVSPDERMELIPVFLSQSFANNSTIEEFGENGTRVGITPTEEYLNKIILSRSINKIEILGAPKNPEGKYWTIKIIEHHKLTK